MILINNKNAIEVPSSIEVKKVFKDYNIVSNYVPFIELKRNKDNTLICEMGHLCMDGVRKEMDEIEIGHVVISCISVDEEKHDDYEWISGEYDIAYHYSIYTLIKKEKSDDRILNIFNSTDRIYYKYDGRVEKDASSISFFFTYIVPLINDTIDSGIHPSCINYDYFHQKYLDRGKIYESYETTPFEFCFDDALNMIYSMQVQIKENIKITGLDFSCNVTFENKEGIIYNKYISDLIGTIIHAGIKKCVWKNNVIGYSGQIYNLPKYFKYDSEALKRYLRRKLYIGLFLNYEQEKADEGFLYSKGIRNCRDLDDDIEMRLLLNFILDIKATCFINGEWRVGRDDVEWYEYTVLFPTEYGYVPSEFLLWLINDTLDTKLERNEKEFCYYYRYKTKPEYIAGGASRRDGGSHSYQRGCLHSLLKRIIPLLLKKGGVELLLGRELSQEQLSFWHGVIEQDEFESQVIQTMSERLRISDKDDYDPYLDCIDELS